MIYNEELFGNDILNFKYDILDISHDEALKTGIDIEKIRELRKLNK